MYAWASSRPQKMILFLQVQKNAATDKVFCEIVQGAADAKSTPSYFLGHTFIGIGHIALLTFYLILELFEHIFKHINCLLSGLYYKCRSEEIRVGAFSIRPWSTLVKELSF